MVSGGGALNNSASVLSADGKYVLVAASASVKLHSAVTAETVQSLDGHTQDVTAVVLDSSNQEQVFTASLDGTVKQWNYVTGQLVRSMTVGDPIKSMVIPAAGNYAYLQCDWQAQKAGKMLFLDLSKGILATYSLRLHSPSNYAVSQSGRFVATFFKHTVFVYSTHRPVMQPLKLYHTRLITCVAIDPNEERIAAGDTSGRILIWNAFKDKVPQLQKPSPQPTTAPQPAATAVADAATQNTIQQPQQDSDSDSDTDSSDNEGAANAPAQPTAAAKAQDSAAQDTATAAAGQAQGMATAAARQGQDTATAAAGQAQPLAVQHRTVVQSQGGMDARFARMQNSTERVPLTTVHWHAHPVASLCFSADGTMLLSGGEEAVLVIWQLDSGHKTFLPRLGGPLLAITRSPQDPACYVITQADNTVCVVNTATMKVEVSIHGMRAAPRSVPAMQSAAAAVLVPGSGEMVLPTDNSMLQFWDAARDCHVDRLQVAPRNTVSLTQQDHKLQGGVYGTPLEPHVAHVAFSHDGSVMATVDVRPNAGSLGSDESSLRFWDRRAGGVTAGAVGEQAFYTTNTFVDDPHKGGSINSVAYHPSQHLVATTSTSGDFKLWVRQNPVSKGKPAHWRCQSVSNYTGEPLTAAAFSNDGSLIAVAAQDLVTLWELNTNSMLTSLAAPAGNQGCPLCKLLFVPETPFLVGYTTGSAASLIVWNLLTESVWWSYRLSVSAVAVDPLSGSVAAAILPEDTTADKHQQEVNKLANAADKQIAGAAATAGVDGQTAALLKDGATAVQESGRQQTVSGTSAVFLFSPATGRPHLSWSLGQTKVAALLFAAPGSRLYAAASAASPEGINPLLIVTEDRQYVVARRAGYEPDASLQPKTPLQDDEAGVFEAAFGKAAVQQPAQQAQPLVLQSDAQSRIEALFDAPSHALPPLKDLAPAFFECLTKGNSHAAFS